MAINLSKTWKQDLGVLVGAIFIGGLISGWVGFAIVIGYLIYKSKSLKVDKKKKKDEYNDIIFQQFDKLGSNEEERKDKITQMFDNKEGSVSFTTYYDFTDQIQANNGAWLKKQSYVYFQITRSISAMEQKEREFLKIAMLLFNSGKIADTQYSYYLFAFVNGNGKASLNDWNYQVWDQGRGVKDGPSTVKFFQDQSDASVDSAINHLMGIIENDGTHVDAIKGGGAWFSKADVNGSIFNGSTDYKIELGQLDGNGVNLNYSGEGSLITIAPPRSGKTQCFVIPNMLSWMGPAVVLDVSGEIYEMTSKWRSENVGPVYKFNPFDATTSNSYNPLTFIRQDTDFIWGDSRLLADMMIVPSKASDPFWENKARDIVTAAIAYVCYNNEPEDRPMKKILDIIYGKGLDEMINSLKINVMVPSMEQMGYSLSTMEKKTLDSILQTAQSNLSSWQDPRVNRVTQKSDWSPLDLRNNKPTIYICIDATQLDSYLSLVRVFIAQHVQMLMNVLPPRNSITPILFMLDEFPRLKNMPPIDMALNVGAKYGIRLWMFAQSYGQLKEVYPNAEGMLNSCAIQTFMNIPLNDEFATKLSDQLGFREGPLDSTRKKLVEPSELAGPGYKDLILVIGTNTKPVKIKKAYAWKNEELKAKMVTV